MKEDGCLQVVGMHWHPYLTMAGSKLDQPYGVLVDLMKTASSKFNFCYNLTFIQNSNFGIRLNNGSFTGAIGQIQRGEFEFMITPKSLAYELYQAVGVSEIMGVDSHSAIYKYPVAEPDVLSFTKPFTVLSWTCMLMSTVFIFFCFLILRFLGRKLCPAGIMPKNSDVDQFFKTFVPILLQKLNVKNSYERFILGFWMIGALILGIVYKSNLTATLMAPKLSVPFINFENMVSQTSIPLVYYSNVLLADILKNAAPQSLLGMLHKTAKPINFDSDVTFDKLKKNEFAVLGVTGYFDGELQLIFSKNGGHCEITRMDDEYFQVYIALPFKRNSIWKEKINTVITAYKESGIIEQIKRSMMTNATKCKVQQITNSNTIRPLAFKDSYGAFTLYMIGIGLAAVVFGAEFFIAKCSGIELDCRVSHIKK